MSTHATTAAQGQQTQHTPWKIGDRQPENHAVNVLDSRGFLVAQARAAGGGWSDAKANARLIAAAPELLEALQLLIDSAVVQACVLKVNTPQAASLPDLLKALAAARAAIAKAQGKP